LGFSTIQKCTVALRMLAYGGPADFHDEALRMGESTVLKTVKEFANHHIFRPSLTLSAPGSNQESCVKHCRIKRSDSRLILRSDSI
jgi:hypothetical protein